MPEKKCILKKYSPFIPEETNAYHGGCQDQIRKEPKL